MVHVDSDAAKTSFVHVKSGDQTVLSDPRQLKKWGSVDSPDPVLPRSVAHAAFECCSIARQFIYPPLTATATVLMMVIEVVHLCERHASDNRQHDLFALGRVRVLDVLAQPRLERARRLPCRVLTSNIQSRHRTVTDHHQHQQHQ